MKHTQPHFRLPRRDLLLLPLTSLVTIIAMLAVAEIASNWWFPATVNSVCQKPDPILGYRNLPDCVEHLQSAEGPPVTNQYNECGYRSASSCGPKRPGTLRIAIIGSSTAEGHYVSYEGSMGPKLEQALSRFCGKPVEVQNLAAREYYLPQIVARADEALTLRPDLLLLVLSPFDLKVIDSAPTALASQTQLASQAQENVISKIRGLVTQSRAVTVAKHFLYQNPATYVSLFLRLSDDADFLRLPFKPHWIERISLFDRAIEQISAKAKAAGVPVMLTFAPQRAQTILSRMDKQQGIDPAGLDNVVGDIARKHGFLFDDSLAAFAVHPTPGKLFYPLDGHLNADGHTVLVNSIEQSLESAAGDRLLGCDNSAITPKPADR